MLAEIVGELLSSIVGDATIGLLFPGASKPRLPPPEGEWNASLGSLAAFLAGVAAMFCGLSAFGALRGVADFPVWPFMGGSVALAILSGILANRALQVTARRRGLARAALWISRAAILTGCVASLVALAGVTLA